MGMDLLQWNETHSSGGDKGFFSIEAVWLKQNLPHLFGVEVVYSLWVSLYLIPTVALLSL